jgi:nicotinamidase-related amidase
MARAVGSVDASTTVFLCCDIQERFRPIIREFDKVVTASSMLMKGAQALRCPVIVTEQYPKGLGKTVEELVLHDGVEVFEKTAFSMMIEPVRHKIQSYGLYRAFFLSAHTTSPIFQPSILRCRTLTLCFARPFATLLMRTSAGSRSAVLFGIEGHVCVLQTALDLLQQVSAIGNFIEHGTKMSSCPSSSLIVNLLLQGVDVHLPVDAISSTHWEDRRIALERLSQCGAFLTTTESILFQLAKDARNSSFKVWYIAWTFEFKLSNRLNVCRSYPLSPKNREFAFVTTDPAISSMFWWAYLPYSQNIYIQPDLLCSLMTLPLTNRVTEIKLE